jgi:indolepyruvate ferredoxin oxidoreductase alpha subunit
MLLTGTADCLVSMEISELLRPGFLDLLKEGGTIICAETKVVPQTLPLGQYPDPQTIRQHTARYNFLSVDVLGKALEIGDHTGRIANVVMMGVLSTISPLDMFPIELWLKALESVTPQPKLWAANYAAFQAGRDML